MTGDLSTPAHLRALVEALPESDQRPWDDGGKKGVVDSDGLTIFNTIHDYALAPHRALVATVASPPVVLALADHLEALAAFREPAVGQPITFDEVGQAIRRLLRTRDALEAAIHRTPEGAA